jgi:5-methylcytosine-specific restriction endonuclease McrA
MPTRPPRLAACCGKIIPAAELCACQRKRAQERKARHDAHRPSAGARGYGGKWQREREAFLKVNRVCKRCGASATIVHHRIPHRGNPRIFWNRTDWIPVCKPCHDGPLQAVEKQRAARRNEQWEARQKEQRA